MKKKRILAVLLSSAIAFSGMPGNVFAATIKIGDTFSASKNFVYEGYSIDTDYQGDKCILLFFDYTNKKSQPMSAMDEFYIQAFQNGISLDWSNLNDESKYYEMYDNVSRTIKDNASLEVAYSYKLLDNSSIDFSIKSTNDWKILGKDLFIDISSEVEDNDIQIKENNIEELTKKLDEKDKEIEELNKQLEEKDKEISRLQSELDKTKKTTENNKEDKSVDDMENNNEKKDSNTEENAEKEAAYITANIYAKTGRDFETAAKKLKKLGDYKDSAELAEKYEKIAKCRFYDDKFYWTPQELADTLKYEFDCRNMIVSTPTVEAGEYGMYYIHFKYDGEDVLITLIDVNEDEGYFENIVFAAYSNSGYFATIFISLYDDDSTMEHSKGITTGLLDEFTAGDDCSIISDGIIYTFSVVNNNFLYGIRSENYKNNSTATTEYTDQNTIQKVQQALNDKGYNCGTADGIAGQKTKDAINAYESASGITVNGIITDELLQSLGLK